MKKIYLHRWLKLIALILPIILILSLMQSFFFTYLDHNTERIRRFYCEEEDSLDVVFLGASELHCAYSPGLAYGEYGYTSYMYSQDNNPGSLFTYQMKEILAHQKPELIFVEVYGFTLMEKDRTSEAKLRTFIENIPDSANRTEAIMAFPYEDKSSCFLPFLKYHGDIKLIRRRALYYYRNFGSLNDPYLQKGMVTKTQIYTGPAYKSSTNEADYQIDAAAREDLMTFLEYCREQELDNVVFVNFPRNYQDPENNDLYARVNQVGQIVEENGFRFLDLQKCVDQIGLDMNQDFYDSQHMNAYGQKKITSYIGSVIMEEFQLTPRTQSQENTTHWQECAAFAEDFYAYADKKIREGRSVWVDGVTDFLMKQ